jgi:hypothetical protein
MLGHVSDATQPARAACAKLAAATMLAAAYAMVDCAVATLSTL